MGLVRVWGSVSGPNRAWGILYNDASEGSREIALPVVEASIFKRSGFTRGLGPSSRVSGLWGLNFQ